MSKYIFGGFRPLCLDLLTYTIDLHNMTRAVNIVLSCCVGGTPCYEYSARGKHSLNKYVNLQANLMPLNPRQGRKIAFSSIKGTVRCLILWFVGIFHHLSNKAI